MTRPCCGKEAQFCHCSSMSEKPRRVETIEEFFRKRREKEQREEEE